MFYFYYIKFHEVKAYIFYQEFVRYRLWELIYRTVFSESDDAQL